MPFGFSRRSFLQATAALVGSAPFGHLCGPGRTVVSEHPTPRPGITGAKILAADQLDVEPDVAAIFDSIREIPAIADGIRCQCNCASQPEYYSLLTCYEGPDAMARHCEICQAEGKMTARLFKSGKSLDQIRKAIDARFG